MASPSPVPVPAPEVISSFRPTLPILEHLNKLGALAELPGSWAGNGFNLIARPDHQGGNDIFLELNLTLEDLEFTSIGGNVPNRGTSQNDINLFGLTYLQKIKDATSKGLLHIEPGIWVNIPATTSPGETQSVARMATIPHGNSMLAEGSSFSVAGPPIFTPANTVPFTVGTSIPAPGTPNTFPEYDLGKPNAFRTNPVPAGITQAMVTNPVTVLSDAIKHQKITKTVVLNIGTVASVTVGGKPVAIQNGGGGVENIPFLSTNANAATVLATFWIETVENPSGKGSFMQLQYVQTVLLNFLGLSWPHVSVATLVKA